MGDKPGTLVVKKISQGRRKKEDKEKRRGQMWKSSQTASDSDSKSFVTVVTAVAVTAVGSI